MTWAVTDKLPRPPVTGVRDGADNESQGVRSSRLVNRLAEVVHLGSDVNEAHTAAGVPASLRTL